MDTDVSLSLGKLVDAALGGDAKRAKAYARQLSELLERAGHNETAERIRSSLSGRSAVKASLTRAVQPVRKPVPVDQESRLSLADEEHVVRPVRIVMPDAVMASVNRFLASNRAADQLAAKGVDVPLSLLMHGPPGCGKTLLARHIAAELELPLLTARSDGLISSFLGSTSKNVRSLFEYATDHPCVLFLDEFDALAKMRDDQREMGELKRVVIALLQNIDARKGQNVLLAATNHPHLLDQAVWRRFSYTVEITPPDAAARRALLDEFFAGLAPPEVVSVLGELTNGMSGASLREIAHDAIREAVLQGHSHVDSELALRIAAERISGREAMTKADLVRTVRRVLGKSISQTRLGEMFGLSQSQVSRTLASQED